MIVLPCRPPCTWGGSSIVLCTTIFDLSLDIFVEFLTFFLTPNHLEKRSIRTRSDGCQDRTTLAAKNVRKCSRYHWQKCQRVLLGVQEQQLHSQRLVQELVQVLAVGKGKTIQLDFHDVDLLLSAFQEGLFGYYCQHCSEVWDFAACGLWPNSPLNPTCRRTWRPVIHRNCRFIK